MSIGTHKTTVRKEFDSGNLKALSVVYHGTEVVKVASGKIILDSGGYRSATTKKRMNEAASEFNLPYNVYQHDFQWYVRTPTDTVRFTDKMELAL